VTTYDTHPSRYAVGVIGHNVVIDCGTHDEAMAYCDRMAEWDAERARHAALVEALERTENETEPIDGPEQFWYVTGWRERGDALRAALEDKP
jgi:hypothetical protein